jgi:hypothetical protein
MDKLAKQLREDAASIDAEISAELDHRIRASLQNITPESAKPRPRAARSPSFWWASSLTGVAAALGVIAIINLDQQAPPQVQVQEPVAQFVVPEFDLEVEAAMLTSPLAEELARLQADLERAGEVVREDVRIDF